MRLHKAVYHLLSKQSEGRKQNMRKWIFCKAWEIWRKEHHSFSECLRRAWASWRARKINEERIAKAKKENGITEQTETYTGWLELGFRVIHGTHAAFTIPLIWASKNKERKTSFFVASQVEAF